MADLCDYCLNRYFDEEMDDWMCAAGDYMDEDDVARTLAAPSRRADTCPYYRPGDEYTIVRRQN